VNNLVAMLDKILSRPIAFHRIFATIGGGATEGLFLSQAYYWSFRTNDPDGWFYKTKSEWESETALNRREQELARKILVQKNVLETKKEGLPCKLFYRIKRDRLYQLIAASLSSKPCGCQFVENVQTSMPELTNNLVQNDQQVCTNRQTILYTENTSETTLPPTPQGEKEGERNFGFEIRQEVTAQSPAMLLSQSEFTQVASQTVLRADVPPRILTDKFFSGKTRDQQKYDRWTETAHPALVYGGEDTPWLEPPTRTEFMKFNQSFIDWHTSRCMHKFHKQDRFQAEADFKASLRNSPESCASRWAEYHKHIVCHAATAAARMNNGVEISDIDKQKFIKHQRAFTGITAESTESIDPKIIEAARTTGQTPLLESVATVADDIWDKVRATTEVYETVVTAAPEGAENHAAYSATPDRKASDYYRQLDEKNSEKRGLGVPPSGAISQDKAALAKKTYTPITSSEQATDKITALTNSLGMPLVSAQVRQRFKEQEKQGRKLAYWNSLLQSRLPSVIADVERQAKAQGYQIVDGQISEVDF
jgi:hypothetical protein